jgi:hypothetical protein
MSLATYWQREYNHERPHSSLGYTPPAVYAARLAAAPGRQARNLCFRWNQPDSHSAGPQIGAGPSDHNAVRPHSARGMLTPRIESWKFAELGQRNAGR